jgi:L-ornithine N5-oxygenase
MERLSCDAVIYATGFTPASLQGILGDLFDRLQHEDGRPVVTRDYRLSFDPPTAGSLYIQGNTEHTHGLTSSLLSNIAVRSGEILGSISASLPTEAAWATG